MPFNKWFNESGLARRSAHSFTICSHCGHSRRVRDLKHSIQLLMEVIFTTRLSDDSQGTRGTHTEKTTRRNVQYICPSCRCNGKMENIKRVSFIKCQRDIGHTFRAIANINIFRWRARAVCTREIVFALTNVSSRSCDLRPFGWARLCHTHNRDAGCLCACSAGPDAVICCCVSSACILMSIKLIQQALSAGSHIYSRDRETEKLRKFFLISFSFFHPFPTEFIIRNFCFHRNCN